MKITINKPDPLQAVPLLCIASGLLLLFGLFSPAITLYPQYDGPLIKLFSLAMGGMTEPITYSTLDSIRELYLNGNGWIGSFILTGSIVFPYSRLIMFMIYWEKAVSGKNTEKVVRQIEKINKYCLLDVVILSLLIVSINKLPGAYHARLQWGIYLTAGSVFLGAVIPLLLRKGEAILAASENTDETEC